MISSVLAKLSIILGIMLLMPMLCRKLRVPGIVGFIFAGMIIGPFGFNLIGQSSVVDVMGKVGMLFIMFLSGCEIDVEEMKLQRVPTACFGFLSFMVPMGLGAVISVFLLHFDWTTGILLGAMFGSHTLMAYPIVSRYGLQKNRSVNIVVGATIMAVTFSLLVLVYVKNSVVGTETDWLLFVVKVVALLAFIFILMPKAVHRFMKRWQDPVTDFLLITALMALSAFLAEWVGLDGILGAFFCGVSLNKFIPNHSGLMKRITFVGNSVFVPLFLLGVGMLIDVRVFWSGWSIVLIALSMIGVKLLGKWIASVLTQKIFRLDRMERQLMFGLTHAASAGTLAVVTIGFNIGVFSNEVLNAAVLMILVLCTLSSFITEHATKQLALKEEAAMASEKDVDEWLVAGIASVSDGPIVDTLKNLASAASLPGTEIMVADEWLDIKQMTEIISKSVAVYCQRQPLNTISRLLVAVPRHAEKERDFITCFGLVRRLAGEIGAKVIFYANTETEPALSKMCNRPGKTLRASFREMDDWEDVLSIRKEIRDNDMLVLLSSRRSTASYNPLFEQIPEMLSRFYANYSYLVVYPEQQTGDIDSYLADLPPTSKAWSVVSWIMTHLRRLQSFGKL